MAGGPDAFTDGFMAMVAAEKERLKARWPGARPNRRRSPPRRALDEIRFEVAEVRGRLDQMQSALDSIVAHLRVGRS